MIQLKHRSCMGPSALRPLAKWGHPKPQLSCQCSTHPASPLELKKDSANTQPMPLSPPYIIRAANPQDAAALAVLDAAAGESAGWSTQVFLDDLSSSLSRVLVAMQDGNGGPTPEEQQQLLGFACMRVVAGEAELQNMAVAPEQRGKGLGKQLLVQLLQVSGCLDAQGAPCQLEVKVGNTSALALYLSLGFVEVGLRKRFYADGSNALLMTRPPGPLTKPHQL